MHFTDMEKHIFTQAQCAVLHENGLSIPRDPSLFPNDNPAFKHFYVTDILSCLPYAVSVNSKVCLLRLQRVYIPRDKMDPTAYHGYAWRCGYARDEEEFELMALGQDLADGLCDLYVELHKRGIV